MSYFSDLDLELDAVRQAMVKQSDDPVGQSLQAAFAALDDLMVLANRPGTKEQVRSERVMIGQLLTRAQTLASFASIPQPGFRVIRNG